MGKSFLIIGLGRFGTSTARMLTTLGHEVMAVDKRADNVDDIKDGVLHAVQADCTDEHVIRQIDVGSFDCVLVCIGDDIRASVLITVLCRESGAKYIIAKAQDDLHQKLLIKTGADRVLQPEHDSGVRLARSLAAEGVLDSLDLSEEYSINEILVPKAWIGKTLADMALRARDNLSVIALRRGGQVSVNVDPHQPFAEGDTVYVVGSNKGMEKLS